MYCGPGILLSISKTSSFRNAVVLCGTETGLMINVGSPVFLPYISKTNYNYGTGSI